MEPNWNQSREPWQDSGQVRRPVSDGTQAQTPLGTNRHTAQTAYRVEPQQPRQQTGPQHPRQQTGPQHPRQQTGAQWTPPQPPAPPMDDHFGQTGYAPELAQVRSENLYDRENTFWQDVSGGNPLGDTGAQPAPRADRHALWWVVLIVAVIVLVGFLVYGTVFRLRTITVKGNSVVSQADVIRLAGLSTGMSTLALNEETIEKGVESNRYLTFISADVQLPDRITLHVRERTPAAVIKYCGILYVADNRGMVLEESFDTNLAIQGVVNVEGLNIRQCEVGKQLVLGSTRQMEVYTSILLELKVMGAMEDIRELDLTDMDNLFLVSRDGYSVRLGDSTGIHAKLRSMLLTLDKLREDGHGVGTVDVSAPVNPTYIPEES